MKETGSTSRYRILCINKSALYAVRIDGFRHIADLTAAFRDDLLQRFPHFVHFKGKVAKAQVVDQF